MKKTKQLQLPILLEHIETLKSLKEKLPIYLHKEYNEKLEYFIDYVESKPKRKPLTISTSISPDKLYYVYCLTTYKLIRTYTNKFYIVKKYGIDTMKLNGDNYIATKGGRAVYTKDLIHPLIFIATTEVKEIELLKKYQVKPVKGITVNNIIDNNWYEFYSKNKKKKYQSGPFIVYIIYPDNPYKYDKIESYSKCNTYLGINNTRQYINKKITVYSPKLEKEVYLTTTKPNIT